jgi:hypothetical protein
MPLFLSIWTFDRGPRPQAGAVKSSPLSYRPRGFKSGVLRRLRFTAQCRPSLNKERSRLLYESCANVLARGPRSIADQQNRFVSSVIGGKSAWSTFGEQPRVIFGER